MCSASVQQPGEQQSADDRSTQARIRDAAIACIADRGLSATTVRRIADIAGVSPGLVIHHFGSMEGLRRACDHYVAAAIRERKEEAIAQGPGLDVLGAIRDADYGNLTAYLAAVLVDDSPLVNDLVDEMVSDARQYVQQGVETGMFRPSEHPDERVALLTLWVLGGLVLHHHMDRILGVDLTDPAVADKPSFIKYVRPVVELVGSGMFTEDFNQQFRAVLPPEPDTKDSDDD